MLQFGRACGAEMKSHASSSMMLAMQCQCISLSALSVQNSSYLYFTCHNARESHWNKPIPQLWASSLKKLISGDLCLLAPSAFPLMAFQNCYAFILPPVFDHSASNTGMQRRVYYAFFHRSHAHATLPVGRSDTGNVLFRTIANFLNRKGDLLLHLLWSHYSSPPHIIDGNLRAKYG